MSDDPQRGSAPSPETEVQIDPNQVFVPRSGAHALKFKIDDANLKREFLLMITGASPIATNEAQAKALADLEQYLVSVIGKPIEWAAEFGAMFLNHNPELITSSLDRFAKMLDFVRAHPGTVEFDNLDQLRERLKKYQSELFFFVSQLELLAVRLKPEQMNHPIAIPEPAAPPANTKIDAGG